VILCSRRREPAELMIARARGSGFEPLHRYTVADSATYANPLMLAKGIVIKDNTTLSYLSCETHSVTNVSGNRSVEDALPSLGACWVGRRKRLPHKRLH